MYFCGEKRREERRGRAPQRGRWAARKEKRKGEHSPHHTRRVVAEGMGTCCEARLSFFIPSTRTRLQDEVRGRQQAPHTHTLTSTSYSPALSQSELAHRKTTRQFVTTVQNVKRGCGRNASGPAQSTQQRQTQPLPPHPSRLRRGAKGQECPLLRRRPLFFLKCVCFLFCFKGAPPTFVLWTCNPCCCCSHARTQPKKCPRTISRVSCHTNREARAKHRHTHKAK